MIRKKKILRSVISYIPGVKNLLRKSGTSPVNGDYYYNIYNTHIQLLQKFGFQKGGILVEFGPGDTLGVGICSILDGFLKYIAVDEIKHFNIEKNIIALNDIRKFYSDKDKFIKLQKDIESGGDIIRYYPYAKLNEIRNVDLILSNAVMEHILDLEDTYKLMYDMLKPGGYCSHVIDYGAHEFSDIWYEHLYLNDFFWKFLMHGRMYPINRKPHSYHISLLKKIGFEILCEKKYYAKKAEILKLNKNLKKIFSEEDLNVASSHIIIRKK